MRSRISLMLVSAAAAALCALPAPADDMKAMASGKNMSELKFGPVPGLPTCTTGTVESGNPMTGPSVLLAKGETGCVIPWHWHTPTEHVMIVSGTARMEMKDGTPATLSAGGFALMPAHHVHQFTCVSACTLFVYSDAAFDIHYVDKEGKELAPDVALGAVKETAARPPAS